MATHSSIVAWRTPGTEEPGGLPSVGSHRVNQVQHSTRTMRGASLVAQMLKNLPAMQENWVLSLCWEDPLENGTATHSSLLAWFFHDPADLF